MIVYLDESGDLGFNLDKPGTSQFFIVTFLVCGDAKVADRIAKKVLRSLSKTDLKHHHGALHAYSLRDSPRRRLLTFVAQEQVSVLVIRLDKRKVYTPADEKHFLYNYVVNVLLDRLITQDIVDEEDTIHVVASQRETNRALNDNFLAYLTRRAAERHGPRLTVEIRPAMAVKGLQVVDCLSWSFFRKYEHGDPTYADMVAGRVIEEYSIYG